MATINTVSLLEKFLSQISQDFPSVKFSQLRNPFGANVISDFVLELPSSVLSNIQDFVKSAYHLRTSALYCEQVLGSHPEFQFTDPGNKSILMSYDFHWSENTGLKLIEINTNASFLLLGSSLYRAKKIPMPVLDFSIDEIIDNVRTEMQLSKLVSDRIYIIDEDPPTQKLFLEFLCYADLFSRNGFEVYIQDYQQPMTQGSFCYNRWTDFYFAQMTSKPLAEAFVHKKICFSPNPFEYLLLADKRRFLDFQTLGSVVPKTMLLSSANKSTVWQSRKNLFFKPVSSFGSKQAYKGASISTKVFEGFGENLFIAQEYVPPGLAKFRTEQLEEIEFKFDLRAYVYQDRVQMVIARLYQGQLTNAQTPLGGFACIRFI